MKKSKNIGLSLNKKVISNLRSSQLNGGRTPSTTSGATYGCPPSGTGESDTPILTGSHCKCK